MGCPLSFSKKTKHMYVGMRKNDVAVHLNQSFGAIDIVENFVYLGVNIDNRLRFEKFISNTISCVNGRLISLARVRKLIDTSTSLLIYKQTILPILDYLCILVNSSSQRKIKKLQPLQNRAIRIVEKRKGYISTEELNKLHIKARLKKLADRRKLFMLKMMYKLSLCDENVNRYRPEVVLRTAPKVKMKVDFTDKDRVRRSPYYECNRLWDKLDSSVQRSNSKIEFTKQVLCMNLSDL